MFSPALLDTLAGIVGESNLRLDSAALLAYGTDALKRGHPAEAVVLPAIDSAISDAERHVLQKEESKLSTYRHMRMAVPWVLANATPEEAARLRAAAPRLLGTIQDHVWEPHFTRLMAPLYASSDR